MSDPTSIQFNPPNAATSGISRKKSQRIEPIFVFFAAHDWIVMPEGQSLQERVYPAKQFAVPEIAA